METKKSAEQKANEYASTNIDNEKSVFRGLSTQYQDDIFDAVESAYLSGYTQTVSDLSTSNTELREALREAIQALTDISDPIAYLKIAMPKEGYSFDLGGAVEFANNGMSISQMAVDALSKLTTKAKQLLTDNTQEK